MGCWDIQCPCTHPNLMELHTMGNDTKWGMTQDSGCVSMENVTRWGAVRCWDNQCPCMHPNLMINYKLN